MKKQKINSTRVIALFFLVPFVFTSCRFYHLKTRTVLHNNAQTLLKEKSYPFILVHIGDRYWQLKNPSVGKDLLKGELNEVDSHVDFYYNRGLQQSNFTVPKTEEFYANQIHVYLDALEMDGNQVTIPFTSITDIKLLDKFTPFTQELAHFEDGKFDFSSYPSQLKFITLFKKYPKLKRELLKVSYPLGKYMSINLLR